MKRTSPWLVTLTAVSAILSSGTGCQKQVEGVSSAAPAARLAKPTPEDNFALVVEDFRRGVQDIPIGFVLQEEGGHSMMTGRNKVTHELIPPAKDGDPYKAVITVVSESNYSIQRVQGEGNENAQQDEEASDEGSNDPLSADESDGAEVFDSDLVSTPKDTPKNRRSPQSAGGKTVARQADSEERKYELVYKDGKWELVTELDLKTEKSIQNAFDHALSMQS